MRLAAKVDANHGEIVEGLRAAGFSVDALPGGNGRPDLLVGAYATNILLEIKQPGEKLNSLQKHWHAGWRGKAHVVHSLLEAIDVVQSYGWQRRRA